VGGALVKQLDAVLDSSPDFVALQEVVEGSLAGWLTGLVEAGLASHLDSSALLSTSAGVHDYKRRYFNLVACRWPLSPLPGLPLTFPERYLAGQLQAPGLAVEINVAHVPPGSTRGLIKVEMFEALARRLGNPFTTPRVLCGDFNSPKSERSDGTVEFWGDRHPEPVRSRWQAAERSVITGLADHDL